MFCCYSYNIATTNQNIERCVCVIHLLPVNEQFFVWWTHACTEPKGAAAGLGWPCWHPCGWENNRGAKISIKSGKAPGLSGGSPYTGSTWPKWCYWAISQRHDRQNFHWWYLGNWQSECLNMWILHLQWEITGSYTVRDPNHKLSHYWSEHL